MGDNETDWHEFIPKLQFAYNTAVHSTTNVSPFEALYGRKARLPADLYSAGLIDDQDPMFYEDFDQQVLEIKKRFQTVYGVIARNSNRNQDRFKLNHDRNVRGRDFKVGEEVWLLDGQCKKGENRKLKRYWIGPYTILAKFGRNNYEIRKTGQNRSRKIVVNGNRLKAHVMKSTPNERIVSTQSQRQIEEIENEADQTDDLSQPTETQRLMIRHITEVLETVSALPDRPAECQGTKQALLENLFNEN